MSTHDCQGLYDCGDHPRWHVTRARVSLHNPWWVDGPGSVALFGAPRFHTHVEAIAYATSRARAEKVAAIQDGAA